MPDHHRIPNINLLQVLLSLLQGDTSPRSPATWDATIVDKTAGVCGLTIMRKQSPQLCRELPRSPLMEWQLTHHTQDALPPASFPHQSPITFNVSPTTGSRNTGETFPHGCRGGGAETVSDSLSILTFRQEHTMCYLIKEFGKLG